MKHRVCTTPISCATAPTSRSTSTWGSATTPVKVCADATIIFPLIVSQMYARDVDAWRESTTDFICSIDDTTIKKPDISDANYALWKTPCSTSKFTLSREGYLLVIHLLTLRCLLHHDYLDLFQTELPPFRKGPYFILYFLSRGWSTGW